MDFLSTTDKSHCPMSN